jgi:hypothetical protein
LALSSCVGARLQLTCAGLSDRVGCPSRARGSRLAGSASLPRRPGGSRRSSPACTSSSLTAK